MVSKEELFLKFFKVNKITAKTEFGKGRFYYFNDQEFSKEGLMRTPDFAGFSDGFCQMSNKYSKTLDGLGSVDPINTMSGLLSKLGITEKIIMDDSMNEILDDDMIRYNRQYRLGKSLE